MISEENAKKKLFQLIDEYNTILKGGDVRVVLDNVGIGKLGEKLGMIKAYAEICGIKIEDKIMSDAWVAI